MIYICLHFLMLNHQAFILVENLKTSCLFTTPLYFSAEVWRGCLAHVVLSNARYMWPKLTADEEMEFVWWSRSEKLKTLDHEQLVCKCALFQSTHTHICLHCGFCNLKTVLNLIAILFCVCTSLVCVLIDMKVDCKICQRLLVK